MYKDSNVDNVGMKIENGTFNVIRRVAETGKPEKVSLWLKFPGGRCPQLMGTLRAVEEANNRHLLSIHVSELAGYRCEMMISSDCDITEETGTVSLPRDIMSRLKAND